MTLMSRLIVYTNNPITAEFFEAKNQNIELKWVASASIEVLTAVRTVIHQGAVLLSDPLSGMRNTQPLFSRVTTTSRAAPISKMNAISPFLSLLITQPKDTVDFMSVKRVDEAISTYKKNARLRFKSHNEEALKNFKIADLDTLLFTLQTD